MEWMDDAQFFDSFVAARTVQQACLSRAPYKKERKELQGQKTPNEPNEPGESSPY
jgi:hypothetical protein